MTVGVAPPWFAEPVQVASPGLTQSQVVSLYAHYQLLLRWNAKMSLTSIRQPIEIVERHYCESLLFARALPLAAAAARIADVGSGAGFPGIPMAIARPDWNVILVESDRRKGVFLRESARDLPNVSVVVDRIEAVTDDFDVLVSRAVRPGDVAAQIPRLASRIGLLLGLADVEALRLLPQIEWLDPIRTVIGDQRVFLFGSSMVPRET